MIECGVQCNTTHTKIEKQTQAIIYAIENYPLINRTKLMKYIFFIDLFTYNKIEDTLLEDCYLRFPNGPVPKYAYWVTKEKQNNFITIDKIESSNISNNKYYYFKYTLKNGVYSSIDDYFESGEIDLLNLTLQTVMSQKTTSLSRLTHTYNLWRNYNNGDDIKLKDFKLSPNEMEYLERFLNTKIYISPYKESSKSIETYALPEINSNPSESSIDNIPPSHLEGNGKNFPSKLPIYVNINNGKTVNI